MPIGLSVLYLMNSYEFIDIKIAPKYLSPSLACNSPKNLYAIVSGLRLVG